MARILFTWELGEGTGHYRPYLGLIDQLLEQGHEVYFALRYLKYAHQVFQGREVKLLQAPFCLERPPEYFTHINSFAKILNNNGYSDSKILSRFIRSWKTLVEAVEPDIIICDFSPTVLLSTRNMDIPRITLGTGFHVPPKEIEDSCFDQLQGEESLTTDHQQVAEKILNNVNKALQENQMPALNAFGEIYQSDYTYLRTFKEMDHYPNRQQGNYFGVFKAKEGAVPNWCESGNKKIFAYLKNSEGLSNLLAILATKKLDCLIYGDGIPKNIKQRFQSANIQFVDRALSLQQVAEKADLAICNAGHGTSCELLLLGMPILSVPLQAEQNIVAYNVEKLGAGLRCLDQTPEDFEQKLGALMNNESFKAKAAAFSARYKDFNGEDIIQEVSNKVTELLEVSNG